MIEKTVCYLTQMDSFAAIEYLNQQPDPLAVINSYSELVVQLYWDQKDLPAMVAMARAGIQYGLTKSTALADLELAEKLKSTAKGMAYNLASFTWPGWAEPGIIIYPSDVRIGLDAAKTNLRLAHDLNKPPLPLSRAYWMLGGHYLALGNLTEAKANFEQAGDYAKAANSEADQLLAEAFFLMATLLAAEDHQASQARLADTKDALSQLEHGDHFVKQIDTAWEVFSTAA